MRCVSALRAGAKARRRGAADIDLAKVVRTVRAEHRFQQTKRGGPGTDTAYRKITKQRYDIERHTGEEAIAYDHKSDGMYPFRDLSPAKVLVAHKGQPMIEKRFEQVKTVHEIAPNYRADLALVQLDSAPTSAQERCRYQLLTFAPQHPLLSIGNIDCQSRRSYSCDLK